MKKTNNYLLHALSIPFFAALVASGAFAGCNDKETPTKFDTFNNEQRPAMQIVDARDYQIDIVEDSILVFDGKRYVGTIPCHFDSSLSALDSLLLKDNE